MKVIKVEKGQPWRITFDNRTQATWKRNDVVHNFSLQRPKFNEQASKHVSALIFPKTFIIFSYKENGKSAEITYIKDGKKFKNEVETKILKEHYRDKKVLFLIPVPRSFIIALSQNNYYAFYDHTEGLMFSSWTKKICIKYYLDNYLFPYLDRLPNPVKSNKNKHLASRNVQTPEQISDKVSRFSGTFDEVIDTLTLPQLDQQSQESASRKSASGKSKLLKKLAGTKVRTSIDVPSNETLDELFATDNVIPDNITTINDKNLSEETIQQLFDPVKITLADELAKFDIKTKDELIFPELWDKVCDYMKQDGEILEGILPKK